VGFDVSPRIKGLSSRSIGQKNENFGKIRKNCHAGDRIALDPPQPPLAALPSG